ncbi:MAG: hypothetical protein AAGI92_01320 [Pseudomonadota bacterium]
MKVITERPIVFAIAAYWCMFWLLNALDKIFARVNFGAITWYGNHRVEKLTMYFERLGWGAEWVEVTLMFALAVEAAVAGVLAWAIIAMFKQAAGAIRRFDSAIAISILVFFGFAVFDVVVGDRAELLEHSLHLCRRPPRLLSGSGSRRRFPPPPRVAARHRVNSPWCDFFTLPIRQVLRYSFCGARKIDRVERA